MTSTRHYLIQAAANAIREGQPGAAEIIMSSLPEPEPVGPFKVVIHGYDRSDKVRAIKAIRNISGLGLKEAKEMSEKLPAVVKEFGAQTQATEALRTLLDHGCEAYIDFR